MNATHSSMGIWERTQHRWRIAACLIGLGIGCANATTDPFLDAQDAFRKGQATRLESATARMKKHPLLPYADFYRWRMNLEHNAEAETEALLAKNTGDLLGESVRAEWLRHLAHKGRWDRFDALWPALAAPEADLRCLAFESRRRKSDERMADEARALWRTLTDLPEACTDLFGELFEQSIFGEEEIWDRARRQFDAGRYAHARRTLAYLPKNAAVEDRVWAALNNRTSQFLDGILANQEIRPRNRALASLALLRLARQSPEQAADYLSRLERRLKGDDLNVLWWAIGAQGALQHRAEAIDWFRRARSAAPAEEHHRWAVRAALRAGEWKLVRQLIEAMPPLLSEEPAWIYWRGRALKVDGKTEAAAELWEKIAGQTNFYGLLAAEELERRFRLPPRAPTPSREELTQVADLGAIKRAMAFFRLDLRTEGIREWNWALRGMNDRQLLAAAEYARRQNIYDRAINTAEKTQTEHDYSLRYLTPYDEHIRPAARAQALDDAWVYGLMRQESRFITVAKSAVGAQGLMQLMPATARWVAKKLGLRDYRPGKVAEVETNVVLGTSYLRMVYDSLDKHPVLASAAYNAGPGRARKWRDPVRPLEGAIYAESIPFAETRDYVKKVLTNAVIYTTLLSGKPDSLKARLGVVRPIAGSVPPDPDLP